MPREQSIEFGVMAVDAHDRITEFSEKQPEAPTIPDRPTHVLASMGIYVFDTDFPVELLSVDARDSGVAP